MSWSISKTFEFSASHKLGHLPAGHQCGRDHGHNYVVRLELAANTLTEPGFVRDYGDLKPFKTWIDETLDHRYLNDVVPADMNPSAETLAQWIYTVWADTWPELTAVAVSETPKTWATYEPAP